MLLSELQLNKSATLNWTESSDRMLHAQAEIRGHKFEFRINKWPNSVTLEAGEKQKRPWNFTFVELSDEFTDGETYKATGTASGDEFLIFGTAKAFLEKAISTVNPDVIMFEADKTQGASRAKLYKRFTQRWTPPGYKYRPVESNEESDYHAYVKV